MFNRVDVAEASAIYGLNYKARCLAAVRGEKQLTRFMVGTMSLLNTNEIHIVESPSDGRPELELKSIYLHRSGEIWSLSPAYFDPKLTFSVYRNSPTKETDTESPMSASLWRLTDGSSELSELEHLLTLSAQDVSSVQWRTPVTARALESSANLSSATVAAVSGEQIHVYQLEEGHTVATETASMGKAVKKKGVNTAITGSSPLAWDPFYEACVTAANTNMSDIITYDIRTGKSAWTIETAHNPQVRDFDYNPLKPYMIASGGDDCTLKFWDYRYVTKPLIELELHSHWVWNVKFNGTFDQFVISSSSDSLVNLWNLKEFSSFAGPTDRQPVEEEMQELSKRSQVENHLLKTYDEHEDSVYCVAWGAGEEWSTFASLSYDGRLVVSRVPQAEQDRCLLTAR